MSALNIFQLEISDTINCADSVIANDVLVVEGLLRAIEIAQDQLKSVYLRAPAAFADGAQEAIEKMDRHILNAYKKHTGGGSENG